jgi:hypothetical protein
VIRVQPSASRIEKTETPDVLALTHPRRGLLSVGGLMVFLGALWVAGGGWLVADADRPEWKIGAGIGALPGLVLVLAGLAFVLDSWTLVRSATDVSFTRRGLWGRRVRRWPAQDVSSFWVERVNRQEDHHILIVGFRNGRNEDVIACHGMEEDLRWVAAVMKDPRGERRQTPSTARAAAEPVVRRGDPSVVPASIVSRRSDGGAVELTFLPLINLKRRWWKLLGWVFAWLILLLAVGTVIGPPLARPITAMGVVILLSVTFVRFMTLNRSAVVFIDQGLVTIAQNQHQGNHQLPVGEIEFVQTFRRENGSELQLLMRGKPKVRLLYGRPAEELEWAARFLRVALKHRPEPAESAMSVDAAAGDCQVCSERMESRVVYCGKCRTPHHEECWSYVGQCSTYGCREIRFTRS